MTFEQYKIEIETLNDKVETASSNLKMIVGDTKGALVSDIVKNSTEYKLAKYDFYNAFGELQNFNKLHAKTFSKRYINEKRRG